MSTLDKQIDGTHYKAMALQPWVIIEQNKLDYFEGAALKYLLRWKHKDGVIDLDKIIHYVEHIKSLALKGHYGEKFKLPKLNTNLGELAKLFDKQLDRDLARIMAHEEDCYEDIFNIAPKDAPGFVSKASNQPSGARSPLKRTKPSPKQKKA